MDKLFEHGGTLNDPIECFYFDSESESFPITLHWHYFAELIYMTEGTAEMRSDENVFTLSAGELMIFHPSAVHSIRSAGGSAPKYMVLKFDINKFGQTPVYAPKIRDIFRCARKSGMRERFDASAAARLDCERIFRTCVDEMTSWRYGRDLVLQSAVYGLLMNIIRCWLEDGLVIDARAAASRDDCSIENVTEFIDLSLSDKLLITDIAERCHLSYSCFARKFREQYGMSCKQYIERMRIYKAEDYLLFTDHDLNFISQETGFSDCSHLIKSFRKYRGVTPNRFRGGSGKNAGKA